MRALPIALLLILCQPQLALAKSPGTSHSLVSTGTLFSSSYLTSADRKLVLAAQDDAGSFVASDGALRGSFLEAALLQIRAENPAMAASDMELAQAILATVALEE
ncbi:DUF2388 domain-containing protein [Pantoea sp. Ap-967]|uniref:DUF2388 domain-containing protein n=1 Tax=Pantoea sp. Ap-967 TaxID=2608362 RepID=UPI00142359B3|nr:DUF2388 domain-containing protein [Pantoea sp. Ap-967]NIE76774.1 DUF2388 domain-containing protein [Pantoea sp. Ap-967]